MKDSLALPAVELAHVYEVEIDGTDPKILRDLYRFTPVTLRAIRPNEEGRIREIRLHKGIGYDHAELMKCSFVYVDKDFTICRVRKVRADTYVKLYPI